MSVFPERSLRPYTLPIAALLGVGLAFLMPDNPRLENALNRAFPRPLNPEIVVIGIDDPSLRDYGRIDIWPRELYAQVIKTLTQAGVKAIGLDVLLSDPSQNDAALMNTLDQANVIQAMAPDDVSVADPRWKSKFGVSALNAPKVQGVAEVQTGYAVHGSSELLPSFARQVAAAAGKPLALNTTPHLMPYIPPETIEQHTISFRDVVNGTFRFADVQNRVAIIGLTAGGLSGLAVPDIDGRFVPGVQLQARAVSTFLDQPLARTPFWLTVILCALVAIGVVLARDLWGFVISGAVLLLAGGLWQANLVIPGVTISVSAILATMLVAFERWWSLRNLGSRDPLTGFGNRLAFTRAVEHRWGTRQSKPLSLVLLNINDFRRVTDQYGRLAGEELLRDLAERLQQIKRRSDVVFRWGPDEFAILLDQATPQDLPGVIRSYEQNLQHIQFRDLDLSANIGGASTGQAIQTPTDLIEAASRDRYRRKYQREQVQHSEL